MHIQGDTFYIKFLISIKKDRPLNLKINNNTFAGKKYYVKI